MAVLHSTVLSTVALATVTCGFIFTPGEARAEITPVAAAARVSSAASQTPRLIRLAAEALHQTSLHIPYRYGGGHGGSPAALNSRVDCSGFVRELYHWAFGVDIGSGSGDSMVRLSGKFRRTSHPVVGDVALFGHGGRGPAYHSGIYIGVRVNGRPAIVAAPKTGSDIKIQQWFDRYWSGDLMGYWHYNGATRADSGPAVRPKVHGHFDRAVGKPGGLIVAGWTVDPQRKSSRTRVVVRVDGRPVADIATNVRRNDANALMHAAGIHGFVARIPAAVGRHTVCVVAHPAVSRTAAVSLGCRTVSTPGGTRGGLEKAHGGKRAFALVGWADDPHRPRASNLIRVTVDGRTVVKARASTARRDVNRWFHLAGRHGFSVVLPAVAGRHRVCVASLPTSAASYERGLGCRVVTVTS